MLSRLLIQCACAFALAGVADCAAAARVGEVEVREGNRAAACFTISEAEEKRGGAPDFQSITVSEMGAGAKGVMWAMSMPKARTFPVTFRMCIPYAGRLPVLPQTPAAPLAPDKVYEVVIEARAPKGAAPRSYRGAFCLVRTGQGKTSVRAAAPAGREGKARYACGARPDLPPSL